jgi:N4-(beta-N-acetylglucosaminyl)-L-asparaginase
LGFHTAKEDTAMINRREFIATGAAAAIATKFPVEAPAVIIPAAFKPMVIASGNGNEYKNGGTQTAVEKAYSMIVKGEDVLDAVVAGVNIVELDPLDTSVGYGGLPNADGVVQLDSCVMHGPRKQAGGVAALEGVRLASRVAVAVSQYTDHHLLAGKGAQDFAREMGFPIEADLNTDKSRAAWLEWKSRIDTEHFLDPKKREEVAEKARRDMVAEGLIDGEHIYGTINCDAINAKGDVCGVTTTAGRAFKIPGRVGDSPILGAGLYVDNDVGAAGSTGRGEANLYGLASLWIVENMRKGMHPKDAMVDACKRVTRNTIEKRLLNSRGLPNFDMSYYAIDKKGRAAGVSFYDNGSYAVCDEGGARTFKMDPIYDGKADT